MNRKDSASRRKAKEGFARLLAATAGSVAVAAAAAPSLEAAVAPPNGVAAVGERAQELRQRRAVPTAEAPSDAAPTQLAWWGNWHNGGWHPNWHNWPNWRNWHNWGNW